MEAGTAQQTTASRTIADLLPKAAHLYGDKVAQKHKVGILARVPLDEGALSGRFTEDIQFPQGDFRDWYFRGDRRGWIAKRLDEYLGVQEVIEHLKKLGAEVETTSLDWLQKSFGDFAELTESILAIRLHDAVNGDEFVTYLVSQREKLLELRRLDLAGCGELLSSAGVALHPGLAAIRSRSTMSRSLTCRRKST